MSDTKPHVPDGPVENDALDFGALGWFAVILIGTVLVSQLIVWGMFAWFDSRVTANDPPRLATATALANPAIEGGRIVSGSYDPLPQPSLVVEEPTVLGAFFEAERREQREYGWINQATGVVRLPIERAKDLVLERGLPVRQAEAPAVAAPAAEPVADEAAGAAAASVETGE